MTAQALAEHLEVSERTIYRDIEALSFAGIPLFAEQGPGGGYELLDGYQTRLNGLTLQEVRALFLLSISTPLADLGLDQALEDALLKLSVALPTPSREQAAQVRQRIHVDTTLPAHSKQVIFLLERIQEAIWHDYTLYLTSQGGHRYLFDPYGLVSQRGTWYLVGASAKTLQIVRVAHLQAVELTEQHFTRPPEFDLATCWAQHIAPLNHAPTASRGNLPLKKAKMNVDVFTRMASQRGTHASRAPKKKKRFFVCAIHHTLRFQACMTFTEASRAAGESHAAFPRAFAVGPRFRRAAA